MSDKVFIEIKFKANLYIVSHGNSEIQRNEVGEGMRQTQKAQGLQ